MVFETLFIFDMFLVIDVVIVSVVRVVVVVIVIVMGSLYLGSWNWTATIDDGCRDDMIAGDRRVMVIDDMVVVVIVAGITTI